MSFGVKGKIEILGTLGPDETNAINLAGPTVPGSFQQSPTLNLHLFPFLPFRQNTRI
jgi:hypothetical protein